MNKKEYIRPVSIMVKFGDDLMDLNGLSVHGKNPDGDNVSVGEGGEGSMEEEALSSISTILRDSITRSSTSPAVSPRLWAPKAVSRETMLLTSWSFGD